MFLWIVFKMQLSFLIVLSFTILSLVLCMDGYPERTTKLPLLGRNVNMFGTSRSIVQRTISQKLHHWGNRMKRTASTICNQINVSDIVSSLMMLHEHSVVMSAVKVHHQSPTDFTLFQSPSSAVDWLIFINIVVFLLNLSIPPLRRINMMYPRNMVEGRRVPRYWKLGIFSSMFSHAGIIHIACNMISLESCGRLVSDPSINTCLIYLTYSNRYIRPKSTSGSI